MKKIFMTGLCLLLCCTSYAIESHADTVSTNTTLSTKESGERFLEANKKQPGVVTLPDGLQYKILIQGRGPKPTEGDLVTVHYIGTLIDGTQFDSSYARGEPASFPVNGVIPGWVEALKRMPVGSTWMLYVPSALAYGEQGSPPVIKPNEVLIFKIKLINIKSA